MKRHYFICLVLSFLKSLTPHVCKLNGIWPGRTTSIQDPKCCCCFYEFSTSFQLFLMPHMVSWCFKITTISENQLNDWLPGVYHRLPSIKFSFSCFLSGSCHSLLDHVMPSQDLNMDYLSAPTSRAVNSALHRLTLSLFMLLKAV